MDHTARVEVRGQPEAVGSLLPLRGSQDHTAAIRLGKKIFICGALTPVLCEVVFFVVCFHSFWRQGLTLAKASLEFELGVVVLPLFLQCWDYRYVLPCLVLLFIDTRSCS